MLAGADRLGGRWLSFELRGSCSRWLSEVSVGRASATHHPRQILTEKYDDHAMKGVGIDKDICHQ